MTRTERLAALLHTAGLDRLARLSWRGLLVLNYHRIGRPGPDDDPDLFSATPDGLDEQVRRLAARFEVVPAGAVDLDLTRPARRIALTFDDGYRDQVQAAEILRRHGVVGSFYVCTGFVDRPHHAWWDEIARLTAGPLARDVAPSRFLPDGLAAGAEPAQRRRAANAAFKRLAGASGAEFLDGLAAATGRDRLPAAAAAGTWMSWDEVRGLQRAGMEVGGHTVTHPVLATLGPDEQEKEIAGSLQRLREELGVPVDTFAYPVGARTSFDDATTAALRALGVRRAFSFYGGTNRPGRTAAYDVRRAGVFAAHSADVVAATAAVPGVLASPRRYA
jgi:peptidoglycan/xylan/chitin deacetylase (PgdA/CDA1 family)